VTDQYWILPAAVVNDRATLRLVLPYCEESASWHAADWHAWSVAGGVDIGPATGGDSPLAHRGPRRLGCGSRVRWARRGATGAAYSGYHRSRPSTA